MFQTNYTPPSLSYLLEHDAGSSGTVRANKKHWPKFQGFLKHDENQLKKASNMLVIRWHDKHNVNKFTTIHIGEMVDSGQVNRATRERIMKPNAVVNYTYSVCQVDTSDI